MAASSSMLSCYTLLNIFFFFLPKEKNSLVSSRGLAKEYLLIDVESLLPSNPCSMPHKENFRYGYGHNNYLIISKADGPVSIISQTAQLYDLVFSYCLPSKSSIIGYLTVGKDDTRVQYIPMMITSQLTMPSFYFVNLISISVGGEWLAHSPSVFGYSRIILASGRKTILDFGAVISRLPPITYSGIRDTFQKYMANYPRAPSWGILDTCYNFTNYPEVKMPRIKFKFDGEVKMPRIKFKFDGEVIIQLYISGILIRPSKSQHCLAFAANKYASDNVIIGNVQHSTFNIVHDINNLRICFGANGCS